MSASRPLLVTDCDEVLLHMVSHFRDWLDEAHGIEFSLSHGFAEALRRQKDGVVVPQEEVWELLNGFFDTQMHRQDPIPGAVEAIAALEEVAEVVVLTNLMDFRRDARIEQLAALGIDLPVYTNQGPKGPALEKIVEERGGNRHILFIDDLPQHHESVAESLPRSTRLHFVGEPAIAGKMDCAHVAGHAQARIDRWDKALPWLLERMEGANA